MSQRDLIRVIESGGQRIAVSWNIPQVAASTAPRVETQHSADRMRVALLARCVRRIRTPARPRAARERARGAQAEGEEARRQGDRHADRRQSSDGLRVSGALPERIARTSFLKILTRPLDTK